MSPDILIGVGALLVSVVSVGIAWLSHRSTETRDTKVESDTYLAKEIKLSLVPINDRFSELNTVLVGIKTSVDANSTAIEKTGTKMGSLTDRTSVLETKMDVFWRNIAKDAAEILHSPDPRRAPVDRVLEAFMSGDITPEQTAELKKYLQIMRAYEPGQTWKWVMENSGVEEDVPEFPIRDGEQTPAMVLLRSMDHVKH